MITKKSDKNPALFQKASLALGLIDEGTEISNLNEYFSNIVELASRDLQYTVLPLDEETFKIDANTRTISIPNSFKSGVGVQGDQVAEIIYFEIDRYFDAMDLNTQNIYIEWENSNSGNKGLSIEYHRDLISVEDKIIFGWPLTNEITEKAGRVKFSVRFYTISEVEGEKKIVYSFSTKPQTIIINESMDFEITDEQSIQVINANDMIINRLQNSALVESENVAEPPIYLLDLEDGKIIDLDDTGIYELKVQAYGDGVITYYLQKKTSDNEWETAPYQNATYLPTDDTVKQDNNIYYKQVKSEEGNIIGWEVYTGELPEDNTGDDQVYEAYGIYNIDAVGEYRMLAQNRVGKTKNNKASNTVIVPAPITPRVKTIDANELPFPYYVGEDTNLQVFVEDDVAIVDGGTVSYQWYKEGEAITDATNSSYTANEVGMYQLIVSNTRNKETASTAEINYRVTNLPEQPIVIAPISDSTVGVGTTLIVEIDPSTEYDEIIVKWYKQDVNTKEITYIENADAIIKDIPYQATYVAEESNVYYATLTTVLNQREAEPKKTSAWSVL